VELRLADLGLRVQLQDHGLGQAVLVVHEAADAAGEGVRQHGHHAVREVDGRPAEVGLLVERRSGPDVVGHVRDVDGQLPAPAGQAVEADGVVVVARGLRIHGDGVPVAEVGASRDVLRRTVCGHALRLRLHLRREGIGQRVFGHDDLQVRARILEAAQDLEHAPEGLRVAVGGG
jgi:hypothetical protein